MRFFLQGSRLDKQHMLHSKDLPAAVVHLEALGDFLLAFTSDGIVREYKLDIIMEGVDPITSLREDFLLSLLFHLCYFL